MIEATESVGVAVLTFGSSTRRADGEATSLYPVLPIGAEVLPGKKRHEPLAAVLTAPRRPGAAGVPGVRCADPGASARWAVPGVRNVRDAP